jgi:glycosyltransferase involved in cell wall biosynthesis
MKMKVCHFANWAPRKSGMYESVKDQIKYERREGLDSLFIDAQHECPNGKSDSWLIPSKWDDALNCDIWIMHSFIPDRLKKHFSDKISIAILHGPTEHMLLLEWASGRKSTQFNLHISILWQYDATVAINKHEYDIMKMYDEYNRLHYIPNSIDLENYSQEEWKWEYTNHPAIISCDVPRIEKLPAHIIWSMPKIVEKIPTAKLNLFSLTLEPIGTWRNIYSRSKERKLESLCESIQLENNNLVPFMRGADIGFNNNLSGILSRVSMEMMALGIPVVSYGGDQNGIPYTKYIARVYDLDSIAEQVERCWKDLSAEGGTLKEDTIAFAREHFDRAKEVKKYIKLYEQLGKKKNG